MALQHSLFHFCALILLFVFLLAGTRRAIAKSESAQAKNPH